MEDDVDPRNLVARQRLRQPIDLDPRCGHVEQPVFMIDEEMMMRAGVGIEE